jgi:SSS family solute:Na+ symporter
VLVTDFLQFVMMSVGLISVTVLILYQVGWDTLAATVATHHGPGGFNPFIHPELGWAYVVFNLLLNTAATLTWQTTIARVLAAKDTDTGRKVYTRTSFFFVCRFLIPGIWGIAALAYFTGGSATAPENSLHALPAFLSSFVPVGLMGLLLAAMLAVHADLGERHLQRPVGAVPSRPLVGENRPVVESIHSRRHRIVPLVLRPVVQTVG